MDDMDSSFFLMRALAGPMVAVVGAMVTMTVFAPIILYVVARWRAHKEPAMDTQLGLKFAMHYFSVTAFHLALAAGTLLVWATISSIPSEFKSPFYRTALGLLVPAGIVLAAHLSFLKRTNEDQFPGVKRLFTGYNLIVTGLFGFIALVMAFQALFAKGSTGELGKIAGAMVLTYGTAWAVLGYKLGQLVLDRSSGAPPQNIVMPPGPPPGAAAGGGGLPPLGGGAYPPLDQR